MKVKIHYLFSKNEKFGSKFISWGTKHLSDRPTIPSHIAVLVKNRWVIEATFDKGVRIIPFKDWLKVNKVVASIPNSTGKIDFKIVKKVFKDIKEKAYDWLGVAYFGYRVALNKFFRLDIPKTNKWQSFDRYFCCEAVAKLLDLGDFSMKAPVQILDEISRMQ